MQREGPSPPDPAASLREGLALYALVAFGSAIGGTLRAAVSLALPAATVLPWGISWGTLTVNVLGSFAMALYVTLTGPEGNRAASPRQRYFVTTGLCGGFTTFSIFSVETLRLAQSGQTLKAGLLAAVSAAAWLAAAWLGHRLALRIAGRGTAAGEKR